MAIYARKKFVRTSKTLPLRVDTVEQAGGGRLGLSFCPGKKQQNSMTGNWNRDLLADLDTVKEWGAQAVVTILQPSEIRRLQVQGLGESVSNRGMFWVHLDLPHDAVPVRAFLEQWRKDKKIVHSILDNGGGVFIHCIDGSGRTSTLAAMIMIERGSGPEEAIEAILRARPESFSVAEQVEFIKGYHPIRSITHAP